MHIHRIAIVGASLAGVHAAEELRTAGYDGEVILLAADESAPHDRPPLSKQFLAGTWDLERITLRTGSFYSDLGIDLRSGCAALSLDLGARRVHTTSGEIGFDGLIIATGSAPRWPTGLPRLRGMHTLRTAADAAALRAEFGESPRVAVLGGGFIGAEVAATARTLGLEVTLVESLPAPLARVFGPTLGSVVADIHRDEGVELRCNVPVTGVEGSDRVERLVLADGTFVDADVVVIGIGAAPVTDWLDSSGLLLSDGVVCDAYCATSAPGVMAAGDVARWQHPRHGSMRVEHHGNAVEQGALAARNLLVAGAERKPYAPIGYVWSDQYEHKIQILGTCSPQDDIRLLHGSTEERSFVAGYFRDGILVGAVGLNERRRLMSTRQHLESPARAEDMLDVFPSLRAGESLSRA